jgi:hypothetical protein
MPKAEGEESVSPMTLLRAGEAAIGGWCGDAAGLAGRSGEAVFQADTDVEDREAEVLGGAAR